MNAQEIMTKEVIKVNPLTTVKEIAKILHDHMISAVPVVDEENHLLGIVTETDLIFKVARVHLPPHIQLLGGIIYLENPHIIQEELKKMMGFYAKDIMSSPVITVSEEALLEDIASLMIEKKVSRIPVVIILLMLWFEGYFVNWNLSGQKISRFFTL
ncbi:MAG: CBS domain-containing protein [Armatimonadetes bacterium]|nr:CBS domain-containing protein [Armatimonadota bacterium]